MSMPAMPLVTTIEELLALPDDGQRHELLDGVHVVTPAPAYRHQDVLMNIVRCVHEALRSHPDLKLLSSPADIVLGPRTLVQPDLFILRIDPAAPPSSWKEVGVPLVAIEVLSPTTASRDRGAKRRIYQRSGVVEYWVVDPDARLIERWTPDDARPEIVTDLLEWRLEGVKLLGISLVSVFGTPGT